MIRLQFYPDANLLNALNEDAEKMGVATSTLVTDILKRHYGLVPSSTLSETELNSKVFEEIKAHIIGLNSGDEFDLQTASKTFDEIDMVYAGKPSTVRAKIGKNFAKVVGEPGDFNHVSLKLKSNGEIKRNRNKAAVYVV